MKKQAGRLYTAVVSSIVVAVVAIGIGSLTAQNTLPNLGDVSCTSLTLIDSEGNPQLVFDDGKTGKGRMMFIGTDGKKVGEIQAFEKSMQLSLYGVIQFMDEDWEKDLIHIEAWNDPSPPAGLGKHSAKITIEGGISIVDSDDPHPLHSLVDISRNTYGGMISLSNRDVSNLIYVGFDADGKGEVDY